MRSHFWPFRGVLSEISAEVTRKVWKIVEGLKRRIADCADVTDRGAVADAT